MPNVVYSHTTFEVTRDTFLAYDASGYMELLRKFLLE